MKIKRLILAVSLLAIIAIGYSWYTIYTPVDKNDKQEISFVIKSGTSAKQVAQSLKDDNLIKDVNIFYGYIRITGEDKNITAGRFMLNKSMNIPKIIGVITVAVASESTVTIQEGLTIRDIDDKLSAQGLINNGEFEKAVKNFNDYDSYPFIDKETVSSLEFPLEGYLYPDTYFVNGIEFDPNELITKMLNNFEAKFEEIQPLFDKQDRSLHDIITMASILQKEVRTPQDYNIVSGILWKRLDNGWHLGADATILYATGKETIDVADLEVDSPYNTRLHVGMPPGPISNPDIEHIKAAITPEESDYWYYLTTLDTGEVIYAKTNDEHNINKATHLY